MLSLRSRVPSIDRLAVELLTLRTIRHAHQMLQYSRITLNGTHLLDFSYSIKSIKNLTTGLFFIKITWYFEIEKSGYNSSAKNAEAIWIELYVNFQALHPDLRHHCVEATSSVFVP